MDKASCQIWWKFWASFKATAEHRCLRSPDRSVLNLVGLRMNVLPSMCLWCEGMRMQERRCMWAFLRQMSLSCWLDWSTMHALYVYYIHSNWSPLRENVVVNFLRQFLRVLILSLDHQFGYVFVPNVQKNEFCTSQCQNVSPHHCVGTLPCKIRNHDVSTSEIFAYKHKIPIWNSQEIEVYRRTVMFKMSAFRVGQGGNSQLGQRIVNQLAIVNFCFSTFSSLVFCSASVRGWLSVSFWTHVELRSCVGLSED